MSKEDKIEIVENAFAYIVVMAMFAYGIGKIIQFDDDNLNTKTVGEMTGMELMWAFYGYSKPFALTLGFFEVTGGILMFFKKTRILGCLFISTILINVILQDIFYGVNVGALRAAIIYQVLIFCIFWFNKEKLIKSLKILTQVEVVTASQRQNIIKIAFTIVLFLILRIIEFFVTTKL
jgi:hypothetical protein